MRRIVTAFAALGVVALFAWMLPRIVAAAEASAKADPPADRVVVMYFHRTQRCPTCRKMGSYSEEAVGKGFAEDIERGTVEFHFIDFQDKKNAALAKGYRVDGPTLIVAHIAGKKVKEYKNLTEIWDYNGDKDAFLKYVRDNVAAYQKSGSKTAGG
jgi:hypothetical protein